MYGHEIGARGDEVRQVPFRLDDHQVHVERQPRALADRFDHDRADREVGDEAAVHHVDVQLIRETGLDARDVVGERGEVGRENRRRDLHQERYITAPGGSGSP